MKRHDGRSLEQLVAMIEGWLSPHGFKIETRTPVFNEAGVQIAEFDIVITGQLGTARISWLVECRDRPSEGAAPGKWIEQLIGRRARFRFDKVMAVSSTGFSPGAVATAEGAGIELRELQTLTYEDIASWLPPNVPMIIRQGHFHAVRVFLAAVPDTAEGAQRPFPVNDKVIIGQTSGEALSIMDLWRRS